MSDKRHYQTFHQRGKMKLQTVLPRVTIFSVIKRILSKRKRST